MESLKWHQVNAWRLSQHCLSPRLKRQDFIEAVTRIGGVQAQVTSAAELALWARVEGLTREDVQAALWRDRTLVKTWAMRGTLHLIPAGELPLYAAARSVYEARNWTRYFDYYGVSEAQLEAYLTAAPQVLGGEPMTRERFASAVAEHTGVPELRGLVLSKGWGTPLKPLAWRGDLCFGPSQGQNVTFINPRKWVKWRSFDPHEALQEMARRYLQAYGPATPEGFARWWWGGAGVALSKKLFRSMEGELEAVDVEGWRAVALSATLEQMQKMEKMSSVSLLPLFDAYTFGFGRGLEPVLSRAYEGVVFRPQGWVSAVVLVDGCISGIWEYEARASQVAVKVNMFSPLSAEIKEGVEAEAERLGAFLGARAALEYKEG